MAIRITSDSTIELSAIKHIIDTGVLNADALFLEKNNLPTKLNVTYQHIPKSSENEPECSDNYSTPES